MSRFLLTVAAGFVGRHLCQYLIDQGHEVLALLRKQSVGPWHKGYVCELGYESIPGEAMEAIDGIFHLANVAHAQPNDLSDAMYWQINVLGTEMLLKAAIDSGVQRFIFFSSVKAVADPNNECVDEGWTQDPVDVYGCTKQTVERLVLEIGAISGMHVCNLRPALVYGSGVKGNLLRMLEGIKKGRFPPLPEFNNRRSMISVDDLVVAAWLANECDAANGQTYIVTDGVEYSSCALYEAMCKALQVKPPAWRIPKTVLGTAAVVCDYLEWITKRTMPYNSAAFARLSGSACYKSDKIRNELKWSPEYTFFDILPDMTKSICLG